MPYAVKEIFFTLQGEGANAGRPAVFCRFSGCNLWTGREEQAKKEGVMDASDVARVVLLMATEHRQFVLDEAPSAHRRTFTIRELAHALDDIAERHRWPTLMATAGADDVVSRWRALPGLVATHRRRGHVDRDVSDPYKRGDRAFDRMTTELDPAVRSIVMWERQFPR